MKELNHDEYNHSKKESWAMFYSNRMDEEACVLWDI